MSYTPPRQSNNSNLSLRDQRLLTRRADYERRSKIEHLKNLNTFTAFQKKNRNPTPPPYEHPYKQRAKSPRQLNSELSSRDSLTSKASTSYHKHFRREDMTSGGVNILAHAPPKQETRLNSRGLLSAQSQLSSKRSSLKGESKRHYRTAGTLQNKLGAIAEEAEDDYIYQDVKFINEGQEVTKIRYVATPPPPTYEEAMQEEKELNDPKRKKEMRTKHFYRIPHKLKQKLKSTSVLSRKELDGLSDSDSEKSDTPKKEYGLLSRAQEHRKPSRLDISALYRRGQGQKRTAFSPVFKTSRAGSQPAIDSSRGVGDAYVRLPAIPQLGKQKISNSRSVLESQRKYIRTGGFSRL